MGDVAVEAPGVVPDDMQVAPRRRRRGKEYPEMPPDAIEQDPKVSGFRIVDLVVANIHIRSVTGARGRRRRTRAVGSRQGRGGAGSAIEIAQDAHCALVNHEGRGLLASIRKISLVRICHADLRILQLPTSLDRRSPRRVALRVRFALCPGGAVATRNPRPRAGELVRVGGNTSRSRRRWCVGGSGSFASRSRF